MEIKIKNYTSGVAVEQTVARIEARLAAAGANEIVKIYGPDRRVRALRFSLNFEGRVFAVQLPANAEACFQAMWKEHNLKSRRVAPGAKERIMDQATRTAWKLVQDWVDVQISLIVMRQVVKELQRELNLFESHLDSKPAVKRVQMRHYKLAHSVIVNVEEGTILNLHGPEMAKHPAHIQLAVLNEGWLDRLLYAMNALNDLRNRQQRERCHLEEMVREIMDESEILDSRDLPERVAAAVNAAHNLDNLLNDGWDNDDDDMPF